MKAVFYLAIIAVVVGTFVVDAQGKGHGGRGRRGKGRRPDDLSNWEIEVDGENIAQEGFTKDNATVFVFTKPNKVLKNLSLSLFASVLYDFSDPANAVSVVRFGPRCFELPVTAGLTFASAQQELIDRNNTNVTVALTTLQLNGTGEPESKDSYSEAVQKFCRFIFSTTSADAASFPDPGSEEEGQKVMGVITLDSRVSVLMDKPSRSGKPGRGRPGGKPGRGRPGGKPGRGRPRGRPGGRPGRGSGGRSGGQGRGRGQRRG